MFSFRFCIHAAKQNHLVHVWFANPENVVTVVFILLPIFGREYLVNWETIHKNLHQPKETLQIFYKDLGFMWRVWTKDAQSWFEEEGSHGWKITISNDTFKNIFHFSVRNILFILKRVLTFHCPFKTFFFNANDFALLIP